ncbi:hypothetical protein ACA910_001682 [Epithemia clementina (nom. ined.)]
MVSTRDRSDDVPVFESHQARHNNVEQGNNAINRGKTGTPKNPTVPTPQRKQRKKVTFDECRNCYIRSIHEDKVDCHELWYNKKDLRRFKASNAQLARDILHGTNGKVSMFWRHVLERAYRLVHEEAFDVLTCGGNVCELQEYSCLSTSEQQNLKDLYSFNKLCPLGIEHLIVDMIAQDAACRRCEQLDRIYDIEERIGFPFPGPELRADIIRAACESFSLGPALFASEVAMALAAAEGYSRTFKSLPQQSNQTSMMRPPSLRKLDDSSLSSSSSWMSGEAQSSEVVDNATDPSSVKCGPI